MLGNQFNIIKNGLIAKIMYTVVTPNVKHPKAEYIVTRHLSGRKWLE